MREEEARGVRDWDGEVVEHQEWVSKLRGRQEKLGRWSLCCGTVQGVPPATSISPRPLARATLIKREALQLEWEVGRPERMEMVLLSLLQRERALGPMPPVVSRANGTQVQPTREHSGELAVIFACSAACADATGVDRAAVEFVIRSGWTTVVSTAKGEEAEEWSRMSAGRMSEPGMATSGPRKSMHRDL